MSRTNALDPVDVIDAHSTPVAKPTDPALIIAGHTRKMTKADAESMRENARMVGALRRLEAALDD